MLSGKTTVLFDLFNTILDISGVPRDELHTYIAHTKKEEWEPLTFPDSWFDLTPFDDCREGIGKLREKGVDVYALSNAPALYSVPLLAYHGLEFTGVVPLEVCRAYKPRLQTYAFACDWLDVEPAKCLMVSANEGYERSELIGMELCLIRHDGIKDTIELAEKINA